MEDQTRSLELVHRDMRTFMSGFVECMQKGKDVLEQRLQEPHSLIYGCGPADVDSQHATASILQERKGQIDSHLTEADAYFKTMEETYTRIKKKLQPENMPAGMLENKKQRRQYFRNLEKEYVGEWAGIFRRLFEIDQLYCQSVMAELDASAQEVNV
ncbi:MAG: hypothetical protein V1743_07070 [Nanoarchaeota archaeon]